MELEDLKNNWKEIGQFKDGDAPINNEQLLKITRTTFTKNISKIFIPEVIFSLCYLYVLIFFISFNTCFENLTQQLLSYIAIGLVVVIPIISLSSIYKFYKTGKLLDPYSETIETFKVQCRKFIKFQYIIVTMNICLILICVILVPQVYSEHLSSAAVIVTFTICSLIALWLSSKIWKYYKQQISRNEELIKSLSQQ